MESFKQDNREKTNTVSYSHRDHRHHLAEQAGTKQDPSDYQSLLGDCLDDGMAASAKATAM